MRSDSLFITLLKFKNLSIVWPVAQNCKSVGKHKFPVSGKMADIEFEEFPGVREDSHIYIHDKYKWHKSKKSTPDREIYNCGQQGCDGQIIRVVEEDGSVHIEVKRSHNTEVGHTLFCIQSENFVRKVVALIEANPISKNPKDLYERLLLEWVAFLSLIVLDSIK